MGRKTWDSLLARVNSGKDPLPGRLCYVVSRSPAETIGVDRYPHSAEAFQSLDDALESADEDGRVREVFVIGGQGIFAEAERHKDCCKSILLTRIGQNVEGDVKIDNDLTKGFLLHETSKAMAENGLNFDFTRWINPKLFPQYYNEFGHHIFREHNEEQQYLDLIRRVIVTGADKSDRTGTGTRTLFGNMMRFDLAETFPLLTTKKVFWRGVVEELLWFLRGSTDSKLLSDIGVKIWDANGSREFLDSLGFKHRREGDLGPVYGFQWRHFGAEYKDCDTDYSGKGVDQIAGLLESLKKNPDSRRHIVSAWNVADLGKMALPPCHVVFQFFVAEGKLSCMLYQRSGDIGLGIPFNIASYSLLTLMVAKVVSLHQHVGLKPGHFIHVIGDSHVYRNHFKALEEQISRKPDPFPIVKIKAADDKSLDQYTIDDFELIGYHPQKTIKMDMAV